MASKICIQVPFQILFDGTRYRIWLFWFRWSNRDFLLFFVKKMGIDKQRNLIKSLTDTRWLNRLYLYISPEINTNLVAVDRSIVTLRVAHGNISTSSSVIGLPGGDPSWRRRSEGWAKGKEKLSPAESWALCCGWQLRKTMRKICRRRRP